MMTRTRATAKQAGASFERLIADYLAEHVDDRIDRRVKTGAHDKGDIAGLRHGGRITVETKDYGGRLLVGEWLTEVDTERVNDSEALAGLVVAKRRGTTDPGDQVVLCTLRDLVAILIGSRP